MAEEFQAAATPHAPAPDDEVRWYRGCRLFTGTDAPVIDAASIVVRGARITAVVDGTPSRDQIDGAQAIDLDGRTVIPGLIDAHQHLATPPNRPVAEGWLRRQVYGGVTAVRDMADDLRHVADLARGTLVGEIAGPDIRYAALMAGPSFFDDPRTWQVSQGETPGHVPWMQAITESTDLPIAVALARGTHACAIKIYADLSAELVAAITAEAHRQGLSVWAHATVFPARPSDVVEAGVDVLSHVTMLGYETQLAPSTTYKDKPQVDPARFDPDDERIMRLFNQMRVRGAILDATASMWTRPQLAEDTDEEQARARANDELAATLTARAHRAGVAVATGTDFETPDEDPFPALHRELAFLTRHCDMSTADVLRSATAVGARSAGCADLMGTVEPGKLANFVVLDEDPLADIENLRSISRVVKRGREFPRGDYDSKPA